jgi:hypothetical protein
MDGCWPIRTSSPIVAGHREFPPRSVLAAHAPGAEGTTTRHGMTGNHAAPQLARTRELQGGRVIRTGKSSRLGQAALTARRPGTLSGFLVARHGEGRSANGGQGEPCFWHHAFGCLTLPAVCHIASHQQSQCRGESSVGRHLVPVAAVPCRPAIEVPGCKGRTGQGHVCLPAWSQEEGGGKGGTGTRRRSTSRPVGFPFVLRAGPWQRSPSEDALCPVLSPFFCRPTPIRRSPQRSNNYNLLGAKLNPPIDSLPHPLRIDRTNYGTPKCRGLQFAVASPCFDVGGSVCLPSIPSVVVPSPGLADDKRGPSNPARPSAGSPVPTYAYRSCLGLRCAAGAPAAGACTVEGAGTR